MPSIFDFGGRDGLQSKMKVSQGSLPPYIDAAQPPTKKSPWHQIKELPFVHTFTMLMPDEMYQMVWTKLDAEVKTIKYAKVIMKLHEVLEGEFFTQFIKKGDIVMLSEGCAGVDNIFSLRDGVLRLDLDKESYERAGLQGRPIRSGGRKHIKARYLIEVDLRQPSMLHGKKGFERIVWAAKNVLNQSVVWLFTDVSKLKTAPASVSPLDKHRPTCIELIPSTQILKDVVVHNALHSLTGNKTDIQAHEDEEEYHELMEWIDMVVLGSEEVFDGKVVGDLGATATTTTLRMLTVQGLLSPEQMFQILTSMISLSRTNQTSGWLVMTATSHRTEASNQAEGYTILLRPSQWSDQDRQKVAETSLELHPSQTEEKWQNSGLQQFLVFQMSDTCDGP